MVFAGDAEGMHVVLPYVAPVLEADTELEGALGRRHELLLVDVEQSMERHQRGNGRLANADGSDFIRLHQFDVEHFAKRLGQPRRDHPAGGAAAGDDDFADSLLHTFP
jgi:hypothetical protein